jgi:hypothetical protein
MSKCMLGAIEKVIVDEQAVGTIGGIGKAGIAGDSADRLIDKAGDLTRNRGDFVRGIDGYFYRDVQLSVSRFIGELVHGGLCWQGGEQRGSGRHGEQGYDSISHHETPSRSVFTSLCALALRSLLDIIT